MNIDEQARREKVKLLRGKGAMKLTSDQQIRIAALNAACVAYRNGILKEAQRMEHYIRTGKIEGF